MRSFALVLLLSTPVAMYAASADTNPADYAITVHVLSSASQVQQTREQIYVSQVLEVVIDGQPMQLTGTSQGVLALGDYKARLSSAVHGPHNPNTYDVYKGYDFLMPDGKVRTYTVTRLGPAVANLPPHP
jgi:hypothetical protein